MLHGKGCRGLVPSPTAEAVLERLRLQPFADLLISSPGDRGQHQQMGGVAQIGNKLDAEQRPVVSALVRQEKQNRPEKANCLYENGFSRHSDPCPPVCF